LTEYLDLEHLDQGVQRANAATAKATMGHVLSGSAVRDETWNKILAHWLSEAAFGLMISSRRSHFNGIALVVPDLRVTALVAL